jgi:hypothetical protein
MAARRRALVFDDDASNAACVFLPAHNCLGYTAIGCIHNVKNMVDGQLFYHRQHGAPAQSSYCPAYASHTLLVFPRTQPNRMSEGKSNWRKASRRAAQLAVMDERAGREDAHFLAERAKALGRGGERVQSAAEQVAEERRLFGSHSGAAGINFSEYTQISVTRSGADAEKVPRTRCTL